MIVSNVVMHSTLEQWRSKEGGESGGTRSGGEGLAGPGGAPAHFLQWFKNAF